MNLDKQIEVWEDPITKVKFYFSHSDSQFTTGVMAIPPETELPKHNRPLAIENLVQVAGKCLMQLFDNEDEIMSEHVLEVGSYLVVPKAQFHVHANPFNETSYTLFKADGDISNIIQNLKQQFDLVELQIV